MCEWMSQNTRTMPGAIEADGAGVAGRIAAEIERPGLRERKYVVVELVEFGKSTVVPVVIASTCGTNVSLR